MQVTGGEGVLNRADRGGPDGGVDLVLVVLSLIRAGEDLGGG
jgi:hypothetical protein